MLHWFPIWGLGTSATSLSKGDSTKDIRRADLNNGERLKYGTKNNEKTLCFFAMDTDFCSFGSIDSIWLL